jgi:hypothetical protein
VEGIETGFLAVYRGRFVPDEDVLEPKNPVSKGKSGKFLGENNENYFAFAAC